MNYAMLGKTGLVVSRLALGTMTFGEGTSHGFNHTVDQKMADSIVSQALHAGINLFDTSNNYGNGSSEKFLGRALGARRKDVIISTKLGSRTSSTLTDAGLSYRNVIAAAEASLSRLGTDYIDLLQVHLPDPLTPIEETTRALENLVQRGLVRYVGYSNLMEWQAATFLAVQRQYNYAPFVSAQMYYSLLGRDIEYGVVPFLQHAGLGLLVWSPLAGGFLSGKYPPMDHTSNEGRLSSFDYLSILAADLEKGYTVVEKLKEIAAAHGEASPAQVAMAWILSKPFVSSIIIGLSKSEQLSDNLSAVNLVLREDEIQALDDLTTLDPLYPYKWMAGNGDPMLRKMHIQ